MSAPWIVHIIEDDEGVRSSLFFALGVSGYAVETYESAADFMARLPGDRGVMICDVRMPGMNGVELTRVIKAQGLKLPIILITGHADDALQAEALQAGAAAVLEKPVSLPTMLEHIARVGAGLG